MSKILKKPTRTCQICGVKEYHQSTHRFFARFPLDEDRCREWVRVTGNEDLVHLPIEKLYQLKHVCGDHFERRYFNKKGNRLKSHAIPTLKLISVPLNNIQMAEFPQHMCKSGDYISKIMPLTSKENNEVDAITAGVACTTSKKGVTETSVESSIEVQDKNTKRPLSEIQEITVPSAKKPCVAVSSSLEKENPREVELTNDNDKAQNRCQIVVESNDNDKSTNDLNYNHMECMDHDDSYVVHPDNIEPNTIRINIEKRVQTNKSEANGSLLSPTPLTPNVCRICLATDVKMYPIKDFQLRRIYQQLTGIVVNPEDQLPKALCWECVGRLISAHKFRHKALRAHSLLTDIHIQTRADIQDFIISKIKCYSGLESTLTAKHFSNNDVNLVILEDPDATAEEETSAFEEHKNNNCSDVLTEVIVDDIDHMGPEEVILEANDSEVSAKYNTELISAKDRPLNEVLIESNINILKETAESDSNEYEFLEDSEDERTHEVLLQKINKNKKFISNKVEQYISPSDAIESWRIRNDSHFASGGLGQRPAGHAPEEPRSADAPLTCDQCGKIFWTHTGLKPFECESCGKCFTTLAEQRSRFKYVRLKVPWPKGTPGTTQTRRPTTT